MPNPFPGMDPYLEGDWWITVHSATRTCGEGQGARVSEAEAGAIPLAPSGGPGRGGGREDRVPLLPAGSREWQ
jgi:hypothetical protein